MTNTIYIKVREDEFNFQHRRYTTSAYDTFIQNLERLLIACTLMDYNSVVDGEHCTFNFESNITFWLNNKERLFNRDRPYLKPFCDRRFTVNGRINIAMVMKEKISTIGKQAIWNMAWIVEYFIINEYNMRQVSIDEIYKVWKTNLPNLLGDVDEEQLSTIRKMDIVTS